MCGIVAAISTKNIINNLIDGLKKLEYRGYDSAGVATIKEEKIERIRSLGKVVELETKVRESNLQGCIGIAHTRWATHGKPCEANAHPHVSGSLALVHNGIIENYDILKTELQTKGYIFESETDTEVMAHLIKSKMNENNYDLFSAVKDSIKLLKGAYGTVIIDSMYPEQMVAARSGSPIVIGIGDNGIYVASDIFAILSVTNKFMYLEEGDIACITKNSVKIYDKEDKLVERKALRTDVVAEDTSKAGYRHFMQKEIFEQSQAVHNTLLSRVTSSGFIVDSFGKNAEEIFSNIDEIQIVACGTSYHAGYVAKYWIEELLGIAVNVEIASEFRYRKHVVKNNTLFVTLSQSGETADTLAALRLSKELGYYKSLAICNVDGSSLVRESDLVFLTKAGREVGVASTKAFTTQLVALLLLVGTIGQVKSILSNEEIRELINDINNVENYISEVVKNDGLIENIAHDFISKKNCLFLGRDTLYPIAMEGALKLKEISYIHAEAYAAGELKHGPLALVDEDMPIVVVAHKNKILEKLISNIQEVKSRGGRIIVFTDSSMEFEKDDSFRVVALPVVPKVISPIIYTIPLQLLSYHVAIKKGTDVDQPRNLAKSVTVE